MKIIEAIEFLYTREWLDDIGLDLEEGSINQVPILRGPGY